MKKRIGSILLSLALCLTLLPSAALAGETTGTAQSVTYNYAGGTTSSSATFPSTPNTNDQITLPGKDALTKDGHTFVGWFDGTKGYLPGDTYTVNGNVTLTALWTEENQNPTAEVKISDQTLNNTNPYYHNGGSVNSTVTNANAMLVNGVLVLNGLDVSTTANQADNQYYGIWWNYDQMNSNHDLVIYLLPGTQNTVNRQNGTAINGNSGLNDGPGPSLTIQGTGTLNATGSTCGIWTWTNITIEGGAQVSVTGTSNSAILNNIGSGTITIKGENTKVTANGKKYGVGTDNDHKGTLVVDDGATLTAKGETSALHSITYDFANQTVKAGENETEATEITNRSATFLDNYQYVSITAHANHPICGTSCDCASNHSNVTWTAWTTDNALPDKAGCYYLTNDVALTAAWTTPTGDTTLCLNGHSITSSNAGSVIDLGSSITFTLTDCQGNGKITHSGNVKGLGVSLTGSNSTFNMYGGTITGNTAQDNDNGGGVYAKGTFHLYGGTITENAASTTASGLGGGVYVAGDGTFTMYGGTISNNTANYGGGVYLTAGNVGFTMSGGTITQNSATGDGGGVLDKRSFTMSGTAKITGNTARSTGGGVYVSSDGGKFTMNGGEISGNKVGTDSETTEGTIQPNGGGVYNNDTFTVSGAAKVTGNTNGSATNNVYLPNNKTITISAALDDAAKIGVTSYTAPTQSNPVTIATAATNYTLTSTDKNAFIPDGGTPPYGIKQESNNLKLYYDDTIQGHTHSWTYTASGATITATCSNTDGNCTNPNGGSVTINAPTSLTYDGNPKSATVSGSIDGVETPSITYQVKSGDTWGNLPAGTTIPTNVGTYTASITVGEVTASVTYTIIEGSQPSTPTTTYTVTYHANGADSGSVPTDSNSYEANRQVTVLGNTGNLEKYNYTFAGWNTKADGTGTDYSAGGSFTITANTTLYAKWTGVTITYEDGNAVTTPKVGDTLKANVTHAPEGATLTYQWYYVNGETNAFIEGATEQTYTLQEANQGQYIGVFVYNGAYNATSNYRPICESWFTTAVAADSSTPSTPGGSSSGGSSSGGSSSTSTTVPVSSDSASVQVKAEVSKGNATVSVSDKQIEQVANDGAGDVTIDVSGLKNVDSATVPSHVVEKTNEVVDTGLTVALPTGSVTLDETALESVTEAANGKDVTISVVSIPTANLSPVVKDIIGMEPTVAAVVDVNITANGRKQSTFNGGKVTVTIPYTPKKGEDTSKLTVWFIKDNGRIENKGGWYDAENKCFVFETEHLSQYLLVSTDAPVFTDVPSDAYYADAVAWAVLNGITTGMTETTFGPDESCTRAQIVTFLWRAAGQPEPTGNANPFTDVSESDYFYNAVLWAVEHGITTGMTDTSFAPQAICTRAQAAAFLYRNEQANGGGFTGSWMFQLPFTDVPEWCYEAVAWCYMNGVTQGTSETTFSPNGDCTRAQIVTMLYRLLEQ